MFYSTLPLNGEKQLDYKHFQTNRDKCRLLNLRQVQLYDKNVVNAYISNKIALYHSSTSIRPDSILTKCPIAWLSMCSSLALIILISRCIKQELEFMSIGNFECVWNVIGWLICIRKINDNEYVNGILF